MGKDVEVSCIKVGNEDSRVEEEDVNYEDGVRIFLGTLMCLGSVYYY